MNFQAIVLSLSLLFAATSVSAQYANFPTAGVIQYEKTINMPAIIKKVFNKNDEAYMNRALESYKKDKPQFKKVKSSLSFSKDKTLFIPAEVEDDRLPWWESLPIVSQNNSILTDFSTRQSTTKKTVFEETFVVKDSVRKVDWKITDQTREIAGYTCRRANAIVMDSVYVVAFYTDEIPLSGGPESFSGLPGMILGVALPHENITWFATSVNIKPVADPSLAVSAKAKIVDNAALLKSLKSVMKNWGEYAQLALKAFML